MTVDGVTAVHPDCFRDRKLSPEAIGVLVFFIQSNRTTRPTMAEVRKRFGMGKDKLRRIMRELVYRGYVVGERGHYRAGVNGEKINRRGS